MKSTFKHIYEWSDFSEHSPSHRGQLPSAAILPDGTRVDLDVQLMPDIETSVSRAGYCALHPRLRVRLDTWGDDGGRRYGRNGATLDVLAPKGTRFMFANHCPFCGGDNGEQELPGERYDERAQEIAHPACQAQYDEERRLMREAAEETEEYYRKLADEERAILDS